MLPWRAMLAENVVEQKTKGYQRSYAIRGPDSLGVTPDMLGAQAIQANEVLRRFGGSWMFQSEAQRRRVQTLPPVRWRHAVAAWIDQCRRRQLVDDPGSFDSEYFITLTYQPLPLALQQGLRWFMRGPGAQVSTAAVVQDHTITEFADQADYYMELLRPVLAAARALSPAQTFTYLHSTVSRSAHQVGTLLVWHDIDTQLADTS